MKKRNKKAVKAKASVKALVIKKPAKAKPATKKKAKKSASGGFVIGNLTAGLFIHANGYGRCSPSEVKIFADKNDADAALMSADTGGDAGAVVITQKKVIGDYWRFTSEGKLVAFKDWAGAKELCNSPKKAIKARIDERKRYYKAAMADLKAAQKEVSAVNKTIATLEKQAAKYA